MSIRDPDVEASLETLRNEFEFMEARERQNENEIRQLEVLLDRANSKIRDLEVKIKDLEESLIEAHLTSESKNV